MAASTIRNNRLRTDSERERARQYAREYRQKRTPEQRAADRERHRLYMAAYDKRPGKREKRLAVQAEYRAKNSAKIRACIKASRNPEKDKARRKTPEYRAKNKTYRANYYAKPANRMRALLSAAKGRIKCYAHPRPRMGQLVRAASVRAGKRGREYSPELLTKLTANPPTHCCCCGRAFDYTLGRGTRNKWDSPSLDRVDSAKGYTVENTEVICFRCNTLKADASIDELEAIIRYMREHQVTIDCHNSQVTLIGAPRIPDPAAH